MADLINFERGHKTVDISAYFLNREIVSFFGILFNYEANVTACLKFWHPHSVHRIHRSTINLLANLSAP